MNKLEELKYKSYVNKLHPHIQNELKVTGYDLDLAYAVDEAENPIVKIAFNLTFPPATIEFTEKLPDLTYAPEMFGFALGNVINSKIMPIWKTVQRGSYTVILVDGNNLAHRAKHVYKLSHLGKNTSILYGVLRSLTTMYKKYSPYSIVVCFDKGIPARRKELVPAYKADRHVGEVVDDDYKSTIEQLNTLYDWLPQFGFFTCRLENYEADDLIAAYTRNLTGLFQDNQRLLIVSGDKDLYQLVGPAVDVADPMNDTLVTQANFEAVTGIPQSSWLLYRALVGDSSDKIPGVTGIGPVMAKKILSQCSSTITLHQAVVRQQLEPRAIELIQEAGGMKAIYATLNCINLVHFMPEQDDLFQATRFRSDMIRWKDIEAELMTLGFVSLINDDMFRDMVIKFSNRHGMVG